MSELNPKLSSAIGQSIDWAIKSMIREGVPVGIDAIRVDISYHTARGWQPTINGSIVELPDGDDLPAYSQASHMS